MINRTIFIYLILISCVTCSCFNQKKAQKQVSRIDVTYPEVLAGYCATRFPVKETFLPGDTVTVTDTVFGQGETVTDTVVTMDTVIITKTRSLPSQVITKTIHVTDTVITESTSRLKVCELERGKVVDLLTNANLKLSVSQGKATKRGWVMWGLIALIIVFIAWRVYGFFKLKVK